MLLHYHALVTCWYALPLITLAADSIARTSLATDVHDALDSVRDPARLLGAHLASGPDGEPSGRSGDEEAGHGQGAESAALAGRVAMARWFYALASACGTGALIPCA